MSIISSVSPNLSPKTSFHGHDRSYVGQVRRSNSRFSTTSTRNSHASMSPADSSLRQNLTHPSRSPALSTKTVTTVDSGTQYTPPNFPPTDRRHMNIHNGSLSQPSIDTPDEDGSTSVTQQELSTSPIAQVPPPGKLRDDRQSHPTDDHSINGQGTARNGVSSANQPDIGSPLKRARGPEMAKKVLPRNYMDCDVTDLGHVIAGMLQEIVELNDRRDLDNNALTRFHSRAPPAISIHAYLNRIIVHATPSQPILLSVVYWIDRLCSRYSHFNISSLTVHRYLITATTVAAKGLSDSFWTNSTYAKVGGVSIKELFLLELEFLERMDWKIIPPADLLVKYYENLVARSKDYILEDDGSGMRHGKVVEFHDTRFEATHRLAQEVQLQRQLYTPAGQNLRWDNLLSAHREAVASRSPSNAPERLWLTATCRGWDDNTPLRELEVFRDVEHQGARLEKVGTVLFRACNGQADTSSTWTTAPEAAKWMQKVVEPVSVYQMYAPLEEWLCSPIGLRLCPLAVRFGAFFEYGPEKYRSYLVNDVAGEEVFAVRDNRRQVLRIYERL